MSSEDIIYVRQVAYSIFDYLKNNPNKKLPEQDFEPLLVNPMNDKKVIIGLLRHHINLSNEDIQELLQESQVNEDLFFDIFNRWEKAYNTFFNKEINNLQDDSPISGDMQLKAFTTIDENDPILEEDTFTLDIQSFLNVLNENYSEFQEKNIDRNKSHFIIEDIFIINFWRFNTPSTLLFEEFIDYLYKYKLPSEEQLIFGKKIIDDKVFYLINEDIIEEEEEEEEEEDFLSDFTS